MTQENDFHESIAPDVLRSLERADFFQKLDDLMCPTGGAAAVESCKGDYRISQSILRTLTFSPEDIEDIFGVLHARGACCDCEILYNVVESSRLKAKYWRARASDLDGKARHNQSEPRVDTPESDC